MLWRLLSEVKNESKRHLAGPTDARWEKEGSPTVRGGDVKPREDDRGYALQRAWQGRCWSRRA